MKFAVNTEKAVEDLAFIASERPRMSQKFFCKNILLRREVAPERIW